MEQRRILAPLAVFVLLLGGFTSPAGSTLLDVSGQFQADHNALFIESTTWQGAQSPGVSAANQGVIYFDTSTFHFEVSENGGAFFNLLGGVLLLSSTQTFTGQNTFSNSVTLLNSSITFTGANVGVYIGANSLTASGFGGSGAALTNLNASSLNSGTLGNGGVTLALNSFASVTGAISGSNVTGGTLGAANGSNLTNLAAANISNGTLGAGVIASSHAVNSVYPAAVAAGTYTNITLPAGNLAAGGTLPAENGAALTNLNASSINNGTLGNGGVTLSLAAFASVTGAISGSNVNGGTFGAVNGSNLTNLNPGALTGSLPASVLPSTVAYTNKDNSFGATETFLSSVSVNGNLGVAGAISGGGSGITNLAAGNIAPAGTFLAENGAALTNLNASSINGGTLGNGGVTLSLASFGSVTGAISGSNVNGGTFGAVNGSNLTNLNGANVTGAASVSAGVLPNTVAYSNKDNSFSTTETFLSSVTVTGSLGVTGTVELGGGGTAFTKIIFGTCALAATSCTAQSVTYYTQCTATGLTTASILWFTSVANIGTNMVVSGVSTSANAFFVGCVNAGTTTKTTNASTLNWAALVP